MTVSTFAGISGAVPSDLGCGEKERVEISMDNYVFVSIVGLSLVGGGPNGGGLLVSDAGKRTLDFIEFSKNNNNIHQQKLK